MIEIIIQPDGTLLVPRGAAEENQVLRDLLIDIVDSAGLDHFFSITEDCERIFGEQFLCG
jgi:hypothetical protein